jgi:RNA polymerase sigma-70 factor (ECF subfamily)
MFISLMHPLTELHNLPIVNFDNFPTQMDFIRSHTDSNLDDAALVSRFKLSGDLQALAILYQRYMDMVYGVCLKYLKDPEASKDAVMQIFEELVAKLPRHEVDQFKGWLYVLTKNHCLMQLRTTNRHRTVAIDQELVQSAENLHLNGIMEKEADITRLENCLDSLPGEQKTSIELFYLKRKSYKEIAEQTGEDWNKVRSLIQNGRRNLKNCMDKSSDSSNP